MPGELNHQYRHGHATRKNRTPEYRTWTNVRSRCTNPNVQNYSFYGGRGIRMHPEWVRSFAAFVSYVGPRPSDKHSIDRIDNSGDYAPGNVRWSLHKDQMRNTRRNHYLEFKGERLSCAEWAERLGTNSIALVKRIRRGWSVEKTLTTPIAPRATRAQLRP